MASRCSRASRSTGCSRHDRCRTRRHLPTHARTSAATRRHPIARPRPSRSRRHRKLATCRRRCHAVDRLIMQYKTCLTCHIVFAQRSNERDDNYAMREVCSSRCLAARSVIVRRCITCSAPFTRHVNESASTFNKRKYCASKCAQEARQSQLWFNLHGVVLSRQELADMLGMHRTHRTIVKILFPTSAAIARCVERPTLHVGRA